MYVLMRDPAHFGFADVPLDEKQALVDDVFHKVARRYDLMNDLMSGGLHRAWKDALVTAIKPPKAASGDWTKSDWDFTLLDVAGGTGDVAFRAIAAGGAGTPRPSPTSTPRCSTSGASAPQRGLDDSMTFVQANAEALPFPDRSFDAVRSRSGSAMCRASTWRLPRFIACSSSAGLPLPRVLQGRVPGLDALYELLVQRHSDARESRCGRRRALPLPGRVDPPLPAPNTFADMMRRPASSAFHTRHDGRRRGAPFRLAL